MTKVDIEIAIFKIVGTVIAITIIVWIGFGLRGCLKEWHDKTEVSKARRDAYYARFPESGDMIELNGEKIIILKKYFWARHIRYEVRLPNGEITDVLGSEIIDKKPIGEKDGN